MSPVGALGAAAESRLASAPVPPQRYGLSIFLKRPLPSSRGVRARVRPRLRATGAPLVPVTLSSLGERMTAVLRERVNEDTSVALHVMRQEMVKSLSVPARATQTIQLHDLIVPGAFSTLLVEVAAGARLTVFEESAAAASDAYGSVLVLLAVGRGATVEWFSALTQRSGSAVIERLALLEQGAVVRQHSVLFHCAAVREQTHAYLIGESAAVRTENAFLGTGTQQYDLAVVARHLAPSTVSALSTRGVLDGEAQAVYRGLVHVGSTARSSDGVQRIQTLLLSPRAEADAVPNLEIHTDDVRCTHSATTSHVHPEPLFYLQSRGLSAAQATGVIASGFLRDALLPYPPAWRGALEDSVERSFGGSI